MTTAKVQKDSVRRLSTLAVVFGALVLSSVSVAVESADPLPSWTDGYTKTAIKHFVRDVTNESGADFVPPAQRIAVFDNDGTLWSETPWVQGLFLVQQLRNAVARHPSLAEEMSYKAAMENDRQFFAEGGIAVILAAIKSIVVELTREEFDAEVREFFATARHPVLNVPYSHIIYQPAIELLEFLKANGFRTFICSGGGADFMRVIASDFYGIEPDQVIGTSYKKELLIVDGKWELMSTQDLNPINNKDQKAINIDLHIGQRPLLVMGNAGGQGDIGMLRYSQGREGRSLQLVIDHNDDVREFAYAEDDNASLNAAKENDWIVISMKDDWAQIYPQGTQK